MSNRLTLDFLFFDAGGGHRSAATALKAVIDSQNRGWEVRLVNVQEILDELDVFQKIFGIRGQDVYNLVLAKGWTLGSEYMIGPMHAIIRLYHKAQVRLLTKLWHSRRPDLVVSLIPNFNRSIFDRLQTALPGTPYISILTDFADYPPHFWMEQQPQYFICGTDRAVDQALHLGHPRDKVFRVSGMILRPQFYEPEPIERESALLKLGLEPDVPTGILLFGGAGSPAMKSIAERLGNSEQSLQLIAICGRNAKLKEKLQKLQLRHKLFVEGFTQKIPYYMQLGDFFIGKPGPGSISEAIQLQLPVLVECNRWTLPQERYNAEWVKKQGVGMVLPSFTAIEPAVRDLLANKLPQMKQRTREMQNRAVFEIPEILARLARV